MTFSIGFKSLLPALNEDDPIRDKVYYLYRDLQRGVRTSDNWKIIAYLVKGTTKYQLFDLNNDPFETNDLSADPEHQEKFTEDFVF